MNAENETGRDLEGQSVPDADEITWGQNLLNKVRENVCQVVLGKEQQVMSVLMAFCARGHILIEDHPGVGKTLLARAFAKSLGVDVSRIQFTPDVVPGDVTGTVVYSRRDENFTFRAGPVFTNILLADEINRGTPRTQSSLLQAMEERAVTVEDVHYDLPEPFFVVATQNPLEVHGTFPLPESQLDRFMLRISLGYPESEVEDGIIHTFASPRAPLEEIAPVATKEDVNRLTELASSIYIGSNVRSYILKLVGEIREDSAVKMGVSPRASLNLARASQARALLFGRDSVLPEDIQALAEGAFAHRIVPYSYADSPEDMLKEHVDRVAIPEE